MVQPPSIIRNNPTMSSSTHSSGRQDSEREDLRRRVKQFYQRFDQENWEACFALIDPQLTLQKKVEPAAYSQGMRAFKEAYGRVNCG
jgi:hypothetical protein